MEMEMQVYCISLSILYTRLLACKKEDFLHMNTEDVLCICNNLNSICRVKIDVRLNE